MRSVGDGPMVFWCLFQNDQDWRRGEEVSRARSWLLSQRTCLRESSSMPGTIPEACAQRNGAWAVAHLWVFQGMA